MSAIKSDPAVVSAEAILPHVGDRGYLNPDVVESIIREAYEPYMQAAEEMARCLSLLERDHYSEPFPSLARWNELIGEVEG